MPHDEVELQKKTLQNVRDIFGKDTQQQQRLRVATYYSNQRTYTSFATSVVRE